MAVNTTAYTFNLTPNASGVGESGSIHQTSPAWILTFLRWEVRDTLRTEPTTGLDFTTITPPLVVQNDCVQIGVSDSKSVLTPSMNATLLVTDVNYETDLAPGDFVFVNMLNWEQDAKRVAQQAINLQPINGINDGFKGFFKIQSVRKTLVTDPQSGVKAFAVKITGFAFTEFNTSIYFNPYLLSQSDQNILLFASLLGINWSLIQSQKGLIQIQDVMKALIQSFIGTGFTDQGKKVNNTTVSSASTHFYMPQSVGNLLGLQGLQTAKDAYNFLFGIQSYSSSINQTLAQGMNPIGVAPNATDTDRFMFIPGRPVDGITVTKPEYWNQVKAWSILNQFTNSPLNELYTCFRISPSGSVMPTMVFRQIPFTTDNFDNGNYNVTRFMNVPRWNLDPGLVFSYDLGKDEVARFNFVQYYGRSVNGPAGYDISDETSRQNYLYDQNDVQRNGLRPYVVTSEFDRSSDIDQKNDFRAPGWAKIVGDALIGGHLKMSGSINAVGIPDPIAVGDNLQFDGVVYHIEQISHTGFIDQNGKKTFRTSANVSNGMSIQNGNPVMYAEMKYGSAYDSRNANYKNSRILPGVSESQDTIFRPTNPDLPEAISKSFIQPNTNTSIDDSERQ